MSTLLERVINLQAQRDSYQRQTDALNAELTKTLAKIYQQQNRPKCPDDGIYAFIIRFLDNPKDYQYAAVVHDGHVSLTGRMSKRFTWDEFLDWFEGKADEADTITPLAKLQSSGAALDLLQR